MFFLVKLRLEKLAGVRVGGFICRLHDLWWPARKVPLKVLLANHRRAGPLACTPSWSPMIQGGSISGVFPSNKKPQNWAVWPEGKCTGTCNQT